LGGFAPRWGEGTHFLLHPEPENLNWKKNIEFFNILWRENIEYLGFLIFFNIATIFVVVENLFRFT